MPLIDKKWIKIHKKNGSCFNSEAVLSKLTITVSKIIPSKYVFKVLNIPESRLKWDKNLAELTFEKADAPRAFDSYRMLSLFGKNRDFYERKVVGRVNGVAMCVCYSVPGEEEKEDVARGETIMNHTAVYHHNDQTVVEILNQTNLRSIVKGQSKVTELKVLDWCRALKRELKSYDDK